MKIRVQIFLLGKYQNVHVESEYKFTGRLYIKIYKLQGIGVARTRGWHLCPICAPAL